MSPQHLQICYVDDGTRHGAGVCCEGYAFNTLWPRVGIAAAAIELAVGNAEELRKYRSP